jgi:hypothetical protein
MFAHSRAVVGFLALLTVLSGAAPAAAQGTREEALAAERALKATQLRPYEPTSLERKILALDKMLVTQRPIYPFIGGTFEGGGLAVGPGFRARIGDAGMFNAHAAISIRNYRAAHADLKLPELAGGYVDFGVTAEWLDAPSVASYGVGNKSSLSDRTNFAFGSTTVGLTARVKPAKYFAVVGGSMQSPSTPPRPAPTTAEAACSPKSTGARRQATPAAAVSIASSGPITRQAVGMTSAASMLK